MENKIIQCPSCSKKMQIPPTFFGKKIKCPQCSSILVIDVQGGVTLGTPAAPPPAQAPAQKVPAAPAASAPQKQEPAKKLAKPKPNLRPTSAITKPKAKMKKGVKVAGKASKIKLRVQKIKPKRRLSGIKIQKTEKKVNKDKISAVSRVDRKQTGGMLSKIGIFLGIIAIVAAIAFLVIGGEKKKPDKDITPKQAVPTSITFLDQGEKEIFDYNEKGGKIHLWHRKINSDIAIPNAKFDQKKKILEIRDETEFVKIAGKTYKVGYNDEDDLRQVETPEIEVIVNDFYISRKEITIGQYRKFTKYIDFLYTWQDTLDDDAKKDYYRSPKFSEKYLRQAAVIDPAFFNHPDQPADIRHSVDPVWEDDPAVYKISWWSAYAYCAWANGLDPNKGNLPTEIEWEIAARGTEGYLYPWGNKSTDLKAPEDADDREILSKYGYYPGSTKPYDPNPKITKDKIEYHEPKMNSHGIYDMAGNVGEWCFDTYVGKLYVYLKEINMIEDADAETPAEFKILYQGGASEEELLKFGIEPTMRGARINSGDLNATDRLPLLKFTYRTRVEASNTDFAIGFRCVYYKDSPAPNAAILKELYDRRKKMVEEKWEKRIKAIMDELKLKYNE
ncbi:MAG: SUMF1/EgtB/PvdO family nonheme iron enzyme [Planctomycetes bacterium]|nr:SUMF1/EgtB/PvdO family nonheme iron enzyme [Planctomycetota bacterium]